MAVREGMANELSGCRLVRWEPEMCLLRNKEAIVSSEEWWRQIRLQWGGEVRRRDGKCRKTFNSEREE